MVVMATHRLQSVSVPTQTRSLIARHRQDGSRAGQRHPSAVVRSGRRRYNLVDCGVMARLLLAEKYKETGINNLAMKTAVPDILQ